MTERVLIRLFLASGIILLIGLSFRSHSDKKNSAGVYCVETFKSGDGWGYQIKEEGKVIIMQPCIPGLEGNQPFPNEKSALETGGLVLSKIRKNEDPSITTDDLKRLFIE